MLFLMVFCVFFPSDLPKKRQNSFHDCCSRTSKGLLLHFPGPQCPRGRAFRWPLHRALGAFHGARHACRARRALGRAFNRLGFSTSHLAYGQIGQHNAASWAKFFCSQSLWDAQNCVVLPTSQVTEPSGSHPTSAPGAHRRRLGGEHLRMHTLKRWCLQQDGFRCLKHTCLLVVFFAPWAWWNCSHPKFGLKWHFQVCFIDRWCICFATKHCLLPGAEKEQEQVINCGQPLRVKDYNTDVNHCHFWVT